MAQNVVIDTDAGVDDAVALLLAISAHRDPNHPLNILGITTVLGNTSLENVGKVLKVLDCMGVTDIPVYQGAATPLVKRFVPDEPAHFGNDGFCDTPKEKLDELFTTNKDRKFEKETAALALVRLAREHQGNITVIALGPLTNLAIAINLDHDFVKNVKELIVMGGSIYGIGNVRPCIEFNFHVDPESAYLVLDSDWNRNINLVPWETCKKVLPSMEWRIEVLGSLKCKEVQLMNLIEPRIFAYNAKRYGDAKWISADCLCIIAAVKPEIITQKQSKHCTVELHGSVTRGQLVVDHPQRTGLVHNVTIIEGMDTAEVEKLFIAAFNP